jgi:hypothetical protein
LIQRAQEHGHESFDKLVLNDEVARLDPFKNVEEPVADDSWQFSVLKKCNVIHKLFWMCVCARRDTSLGHIDEQGLEVSLGYLLLKVSVHFLIKVFNQDKRGGLILSRHRLICLVLR